MNPPENIADHFLAPRRQTRRAWQFVIAALIAVTSLFIAVLLFYDIPPVDDTALLPPPAAEETGNPLDVFLAAVPPSLPDEIDALAAEVTAAKPGTESPLREQVRKHSATLQAMEVLMETDATTWRFSSARTWSPVDPGPAPARLCLEASRMLNFRAGLKQQEGDCGGALEDTLMQLHFASGLEQAHGHILALHSCAAMRDNARKRLRKLLYSSNFTQERLALLQEELMRLTPRPRDLKPAMQFEHQYFKAGLQRLKSGARGLTLTEGQPIPPLFQRMLKPNMTTAARLSYLLPVHQAMDSDWRTVYLANENMEAAFRQFTHSKLRFYCIPNLSGNAMLPTLLGQQAIAIDILVRKAVEHDLVMLEVALRRHELQHGRLPAKLEQLVPDFLPALPDDSFDTRPLKWNASTQMIYSVGRDGNDDGGITKVSSRPPYTKDLAIHYGGEPTPP